MAGFFSFFKTTSQNKVLSDSENKFIEICSMQAKINAALKLSPKEKEKYLMDIYSRLRRYPVIPEEVQSFKYVFLSLSAKEVMELGERFRSSYRFSDYYDSWKAAHPDALFAQVKDQDALFTLLAVGTFHPNGFYRERCLVALQGFGVNGLPFLFLSLNSWVAQIRQQALEILQETLQQASPQALLHCLPYWEKVSRGQRKDDAVYRQIQKHLRTVFAQHEAVSLEAVFAAPRDCKRCYLKLVGIEAFSEEEWLVLFTKETDPFHQFLIFQVLMRQEQVGPELLDRLLQSPVASIRERVLRYKCKSSMGVEELKPYLLDNSKPVRGFVRFELKQRGFTGFAAFYLKVLAQPPSSVAILGLAESHAKEHADVIKSYLEHAELSLVRAAIAGLGILLGHDEALLYYRYLLSEQVGCAGVAFKIIKQQHIYYPLRQVYQDFKLTRYPHTQRYLCQLIYMGHGWEQLPWLLYLTQELDKQIQETAYGHLREWSAPYATTPTQEEIAEIEEALQRVKLSNELYRVLKFKLSPQIILP